MARRPDRPRIAPLTADEQTEEQRELLGALGAGSSMHIFATFARHPGLFRRWLPFAGKLLQGSRLTPRDRELVILRVAWRCRAAYEWGQHVDLARNAGLSQEEIRRVSSGPGTEGWAAEDAELLRAVDELHDHDCIADDTWKQLSLRYNEQQLIELPMLAGHYSMLAGALNSLGVQTEDRLPGLGEA